MSKKLSNGGLVAIVLAVIFTITVAVPGLHHLYLVNKHVEKTVVLVCDEIEMSEQEHWLLGMMYGKLWEEDKSIDRSTAKQTARLRSFGAADGVLSDIEPEDVETITVRYSIPYVELGYGDSSIIRGVRDNGMLYWTDNYDMYAQVIAVNE